MNITQAEIQQVLHERLLVDKFRNAVQNCKEMLGFKKVMTDDTLDADGRMAMEKCITQNYLLKHGLNYFGRRDLLYIDMMGDKDVNRLYSRELIEELGEEEAAELGADLDAADDDE